MRALMFHDPLWGREYFLLQCMKLWQVADCETPTEVEAVLELYRPILGEPKDETIH